MNIRNKQSPLVFEIISASDLNLIWELSTGTKSISSTTSFESDEADGLLPRALLRIVPGDTLVLVRTLPKAL
jgi:hypothetical protein